MVQASAWTLHKQLKIQRRLAWSLSKNDTHNRSEKAPFFYFLTGTHIFQ